MNGLIGKKLGMTQVHDEKGALIPVTVIAAGPCFVVQRKTTGRDGYEAVQLGFSEQKKHRVSKASLGRFEQAKVAPLIILREFFLEQGEDVKEGDSVGVSVLKGVSLVDVTGITKGRGFQGVVRRHGMAGGPITHGGHSKRRIGSIGCKVTPARVHKGHRMPGHMGQVRATQKNLRVIGLKDEQNILLVRGAIPGSNGSFVMIKKSIKGASKS